MKLHTNLTLGGLFTSLLLSQAVLAISAQPRLNVLATPVSGLEQVQALELQNDREEAAENTAIENTVRQFTDGVLNLEIDENDPKALNVLERAYFRKYEEVISNLHASVENETDLIYFVNTSENRNQCENLAGLSFQNQHMMVVKRVAPNVPMLQRNNQGQVTGLNMAGVKILALQKDNSALGINYAVTPQFLSSQQFNNSLSPLVPVSTGVPGGGKIRTYSGIFRVNEERTNSRTKSEDVVSGRDPMQFSVYINGEYSNDGKESGLAIHGTPPQNWGLLGRSRASSGCIRVHTEFSRWNRAMLFDYRNASRNSLVAKADLSGSVRLWSRRDHFPPAEQVFQTLPRSNDRKLKVLIVFFDGYNGSCS